MEEPLFSLVAYLPGKLGEFVDELRRRLNPAFATSVAHVTILPPRPLRSTVGEILTEIRQRCAQWEPFEAAIEGVATFWPANGVVYLAVSAGSEHLVRLHETLNSKAAGQVEVYTYVPHVTIAQELDEAATQAVLAESSRAWSQFEGGSSFWIESLFFVQLGPENRWIDLAPVQLGSLSVPFHR